MKSRAYFAKATRVRFFEVAAAAAGWGFFEEVEEDRVQTVVGLAGGSERDEVVDAIGAEHAGEDVGSQTR